ncbi:MAG: GIY-YIG nuclease family protein [Candidatus Paceibacterota bacterium]
MFYVYIIHSKKLDKFYIGSTDNLQKRITAHNKKETPFTAKGIPWKLIYYEAFIEKGDALREERFFKTGKGRERRKYLLADFLDKFKKIINRRVG